MAVIELTDITSLASARHAARSGRARELRVGAGFSQAEFAAYCGVTPTTIGLWESGKRRPSGEAAQRYAELLELLSGLSLIHE